MAVPMREFSFGGSPSIAAGAPHVIHELLLEHQHAQQQISQLQDHLMQLADLSSLLGELPDKSQHNVMVPFGPMAFFPGKLIHCNETLITLGASCLPRTTAHDAEKHHPLSLAGQDTVVERSAKQTQQLLARRSKVLGAACASYINLSSCVCCSCQLWHPNACCGLQKHRAGMLSTSRQLWNAA